MIVCKKIKCLKYPLCRNKKMIKCKLLLNYFNNLPSYTQPTSILEVNEYKWIEIKKYFPHLTGIFKG